MDNPGVVSLAGFIKLGNGLLGQGMAMRDVGSLWCCTRVFNEGKEVHKGAEDHHFRAFLLGTAGTGKTTTLKSLIRELKARGLRKVIVGAYTGVAASNVGLGARTLTDLFRLAKQNEASGDLQPLEGDDLAAFQADMEDLELLIIDEVSMVSRVVLQQIHARLREW